jgi:hypothetical protein
MRLLKLRSPLKKRYWKKNKFQWPYLSDDNALYTVVWRIKDGVSPDASGTTETLHVLEGVWLGYKNWPDWSNSLLE